MQTLQPNGCIGFNLKNQTNLYNEPLNVELKPLYATKSPCIDPKLNKHKKNWLHNFNGGI